MAEAIPVAPGTQLPAVERGWRPPANSRLTTIVLAVVAMTAILTILYAWDLPPFAGWSEATDNAALRGRVTVISPQVSGYVTSAPVRDYTEVRRGEILATIDDRIYRARVDQAAANVKAQEAALANAEQARRSREVATKSQDAGVAGARAQLVRAAADMKRASALVADGSISAREFDQTQAALQSAEAALRQALASRAIGTEDVRTVVVGRGGLRAAVEGARAQLRLAQIDLAHTVIRAPTDGRISEVGVRIGAYVTAGTQMLFLVPRNIWAVANFKEAQTRDMRVGQAARFTVDALGGRVFEGRVESLSPATGSEFAVLKADNATGNFVKVAQRIAVRVAITSGQAGSDRLRPGMSVEMSIVTRDGRKS